MRKALVVLAALVAGGCGAGAGGGGDSAVDFQLFGDAEEIAAYRELIAAYERQSGERVRLIAVGDRKDHMAKLTASFAARRPPDVFLLNHRNMGAFAARGSLDPVGPRLEAPGGPEADSYYELPREAFEFGGELQCLPQNTSSLVVYVNLDRFRAAGVEVPRSAWSYDEFLEAARALTRDGGHGVGVEPSVIRVAPFVWSAGGELVDDLGNPTRFALDSPAARRGLEAVMRLGRADVAPSAREVESKALEERFLAGELAMFLSSRREVPTFRTIDDFEWDVAPLPVIDEPASVLHSDGFCLARAGSADAAWRFVEFAGGPAGQRLLARAGRTVPSLKEVARSPDFLDPSRPPRSSQVFLDQIEVMRRLPTTANWLRVEESAELALAEAFYGRASIDEALERIHAETDGRF